MTTRLPGVDVSRAPYGGGLAPEPKVLVIEAIVGLGTPWCSLCRGAAPVGVEVKGADSRGSFVFCHSCADRIGGQSARLSEIVREQLEAGRHHE